MKLRKWTCPNCKTKNISDLDELRKPSTLVYRGPQIASKPGEFLVKCQSCYHQHVIVVNKNE